MSRAEAMLDDEMHWIHNDSGNNNNNNNGQRVLLRPPAKIERERLLQQQNQKETTTIQSSSYQNGRDTNINDNEQDDDEKIPFHRSLSLPSLQDALSKANANVALQQGKQHHELIVIKQQPSKKYIVKERKFECNALCRVFLGKRGLRSYTLVLSLFIVGTLWAYTSVFASAMARAFPIFSVDDNNEPGSVFHLATATAAVTTAESSASLDYVCYAILFGCMVVPLSCLELDEQVPLQVFLTVCRFLMFFLMIGTSGMCANDLSAISAITTAKSGETEQPQEDYINKVDNFRWDGVAKTLPVLIFANIFHHSIPGLTHPADKRIIGRVFLSTNVFTVTAYLILGISLGTAFGKGIEQSSNLTWSSFHANTGQLDDEGNIVGAAWWTQAVSMYIMLFPAIDVVSAYPLNAITLGNNLFGAVYGKRIHEVENNRWLRTSFRLLASIPPIICGILVRELGVITDYTGTTGFLIGLSFPAILYIASRKIAQRRHFALDTFYTSYGSTTAIANFILWIGIVMVLFVFISLTFFG